MIPTKRRIDRVTTGDYTFSNAVSEAQARGFVVHTDAKAEWSKWTHLNPSKRKLLMNDGTSPTIGNIICGRTAKLKMNAEQKKIVWAKTAATQKERGNNIQQNFKEATAIASVMRILNVPDVMEWRSVPDGLGPDMAVRMKGTQLYAPVQVKSAVGFQNGQINYSVSRSDGGISGKYHNMLLLAVRLRSFLQQKCKVLDEVQTVEVAEIFVYASAADMPGKSLQPYPRNKIDDKYGDHRYVFGFDNPERLEVIRSKFKHMITNQAQYTEQEIWFGTSLNTTVSLNHTEEISNIKILADIVGFQNLRAPWRQMECTDLILINSDKTVGLSLKTAIEERTNNFWVPLKTAPNWVFCNYMVIFYRGLGGVRTHVSVIPASRAYAALNKTRDFKSKPTLFWSNVHKDNKDILTNRFCLTDIDIRDKIMTQLI